MSQEVKDEITLDNNRLMQMAGLGAVEKDESQDDKTKTVADSHEQEIIEEEQEPSSESATEEKDAEQSAESQEETEQEDEGLPKGVKKRIDKVTKKRKEAEEALEKERQRVAELTKKLEALEANKVAEPEKPKSEYDLSNEELKAIKKDKAIERLRENEKDMPLDKRTFLTNEEANELMLDNPHAYNLYREREQKAMRALDEALEPKQEAPQAAQDQNKQYNEFVSAYPELDVRNVLSKMQTNGTLDDNDAFNKAMHEESELLGEFADYIAENVDQNKPMDIKKVAKDFYKSKEQNEKKKLEEEKAELEQEIARLKGLDTGVSSTALTVDKGKGKKDADDEKWRSGMLARAGIR